jgi:hypothetical protein
MIEGGVIVPDDMPKSKVALVYGQMNEPPGARMRVALTGLTLAEQFRDESGTDVLFFIDNIFRFTQAGSECSALLGRIPSAVGYQPTLATDMGALQERITSTKQGSITSVQAIYVPADDLTDPAPATSFAHLDATTVLSRQIAELGIYPAVDPLDSTSRVLDPMVLGQEHYDVARDVQGILQKYKSLQDIIAILGMDRGSMFRSTRPSTASSGWRRASSTTCRRRRSTWSATSTRRSRRLRRWPPRPRDMERGLPLVRQAGRGRQPDTVSRQRGGVLQPGLPRQVRQGSRHVRCRDRRQREMKWQRR